MTTHRISDITRATGLPTTTVRYYERIGLIPAPQRTESGYRAYDARALDRLTFVARAKTLGLRLDDIGELADLWDRDRCGPVQARLRDLIAAKIAKDQAHATELLRMSEELSAFADELQAPAADASCGEDCGCQRPVETRPTLDVVPAVGPGIACTLDAAEAGDRVAEWRSVAALATARDVRDDGIRLTFAPDIDLRSVADLVAREQGCCAFLSFTIAVTPGSTTLDVSGPRDVPP